MHPVCFEAHLADTHHRLGIAPYPLTTPAPRSSPPTSTGRACGTLGPTSPPPCACIFLSRDPRGQGPTKVLGSSQKPWAYSAWTPAPVARKVLIQEGLVTICSSSCNKSLPFSACSLIDKCGRRRRGPTPAFRPQELEQANQGHAEDALQWAAPRQGTEEVKKKAVPATRKVKSAVNKCDGGMGGVPPTGQERSRCQHHRHLRVCKIVN